MSKSEPAPLSALAHALRPGRYGAAGTYPVSIVERRLETVQVTARKGADTALAAAGRDLLGGDPPAAGQVLITSGLKAVWLQPRTWLVMAPWQAHGNLADRLAGALGATAAIVDQTFGKACIEIQGPHARDVLAKGCRVDLHQRVFAPGQAAVTPVAHISCVIVQTGAEPVYELIVPAALAASFAEWLTTSAAEYGYVVA